jgi:hypothetical protein
LHTGPVIKIPAWRGRGHAFDIALYRMHPSKSLLHHS